METATPFNLKESIRLWREALSVSSAINSEAIEELESHLLGSLQGLQAKGLSEEEAFFVARRRMGSTDSLSREFEKINVGSVWRDRALWMLTGALLLMILVPLADFAGFFTFALGRFIGGHAMRRAISAFSIVATEATLALAFYRYSRSHHKAVEAFFGKIFKHPYVVGFALIVVLQIVWAVDNQLHGATFGSRSVHAPLTGTSFLNVWPATRMFVQNVAAWQRPFGTGPLAASLMQVLPKVLFVATLTFLARRRWSRAYDTRKTKPSATQDAATLAGNPRGRHG